MNYVERCIYKCCQTNCPSSRFSFQLHVTKLKTYLSVRAFPLFKLDHEISASNYLKVSNKLDSNTSQRWMTLRITSCTDVFYIYTIETTETPGPGHDNVLIFLFCYIILQNPEIIVAWAFNILIVDRRNQHVQSKAHNFYQLKEPF